MSQLNLNTNYIDFDNGRSRIIVNGPAEISNDGKYEIVKFTGDGTFQITKAARPIEFLVVGGGGPGGANNKYYPGGAGGGGGQVVTGSFNSVANYQYQVKVGAGGTSVPVNINLFNATGGLESTYVSGGVTYKVHTFTSGTQTLTVNAGYTKAEMLVVGGGGGGATGGILGVGGEGGQGGGVIYYSAYDLQVATGSAGTYTIKVGNGGASDTAGQTSSFAPNFSYSTGYTLTAIGGQAGVSGSQARIITSGSALGYTSMSYYAAPGGNNLLNNSVSTGSLLTSRKAQNWRYRVGGAGPYGTVYHPTIYSLQLQLETRITGSVPVPGNLSTDGNYLDYYTTFYANPNCENFGLIPSSGSVFYFDNPIIYANQKYPVNIIDARMYLTAGKVDAFKSWPLTSAYVWIDYQDQNGNWIPYISAIATNLDPATGGDIPCGYMTLANKVYLQAPDGGGNGANGINYTLQNGTSSYYGGGGGGGVFDGFTSYFSSTGSQNLYTGSWGGLGGGGKGAGALLSIVSGSASGSLTGQTGSANTGGGGGGGFASTTVGNRTAGGAGGSGIVIIRYPVSGSENVFNATGSNGGNSSISGNNFTASYFSVVASGGGAGGGEVSSSYNPTPLTGINGANGGSGGGAGWGKSADGSTVLTGSFGLTLAAYGNNGAAAVAGTLSSGGGGGAAATGSGKNGGAGLPIYISGSGTTYVGAGGAAYGGTGAAGSGSYGSGGSGNGGQGKDGVVIVKFSTSTADNLY